MIEAWTDKGAAWNHVDSKSKVEIQSSNSDHLIEGSKLFFSFLHFLCFPFLSFFFPFLPCFGLKLLASILYYMGFPTWKIEAFE